jgi:tetratricopeptide (TPR) repeat protein
MLPSDASIKQPPERLRIFVSSTIGECASERVRVREAIVSLNHEPFLFEDAGARPYPPRTLYLRKLRESDIFVGIYKLSYGWVAPEAEISGLEDEYREAIKSGIPCLLYIYADRTSRDPRLTALLAEFEQGGNTFSHYQSSDDLYTRVRDDLTSVIVERFLRMRSVEPMVVVDFGSKSSADSSVSVIERPQLEQAILLRLGTEPILAVVGGPGSGKTIALSLLAKNNRFHFISASGIQPGELIQIINNRLRASRAAEAEYFLSSDNALTALKEEIERHYEITLVIDDLFDDQSRDTISELLKTSTGVYRLVYSTSETGVPAEHPRFVIPPLTEEEASQLFNKSAWVSDSAARSRLIAISGGNPLLLRYVLDSGSEVPPPSLVTIATTGYLRLLPRAKEILAYLAISGAQLSLEEIVQLVTEGPGAPSQVLADLEPAKEFLVETVFGFTLKHQHQRHAIIGALQEHPQALAYYARRVARLLRRRGDNVLAFRVLDHVSDNDRIPAGYAAIFDASRVHDFRTVRPILVAMIRALGDSADFEDVVRLHLGLSDAALVLGDLKESDESLRIAEETAKESGDPTLIGFAHEVSVWHGAITHWDASSIEALRALRDTYRDEGDVWSFGRMALEISALNIRMDRFVDAAQEAADARAAFSEVSDAYGESLATMNLASALSGIPGRELELEQVLRDIRESQRVGPSKRVRAWFANLMVRRLRRERNFSAAKRYAQEAIEIGNELGELHLVALNRINLGNVLRDEGNLREALREYEAASALSNKLGELGTEASAERLISSIHLSLKEMDLALQHGSHAVAVLQGSAASSDAAECLEQLGDVQKELRRDAEARENFLKASAIYRTLNEPEDQWRIGEYLLSVLAREDLRMEYCSAVDSLTGAETDLSSDDDQVWPEQLYRRLGALVEAVPETHMIGVLGKCFQLLLNELVDPVARFLFIESSETLLKRRTERSDEWRTILPLLSLLTAVPARLIHIEDLQYLALELERRVQGIHVRPDGNGAPTWTIVLDFKYPVICSINGFDESKETALIIFLLVIFFKGFGRLIQSEIIGDTSLIRRELVISVGNERHIPDGIRVFLESSLKDSDSCVSRPTDFRDTQALPTNVFFKESIVDDWTPGTGKTSQLHILLGQTLLEIIYQLFGGQIDEEVLRPKLLNVIRETIS